MGKKQCYIFLDAYISNFDEGSELSDEAFE